MQAASARAQQAEIDRPKSAPVVVAIRLQLGSLRGRHAFERWFDRIRRQGQFQVSRQSERAESRRKDKRPHI